MSKLTDLFADYQKPHYPPHFDELKSSSSRRVWTWDSRGYPVQDNIERHKKAWDLLWTHLTSEQRRDLVTYRAFDVLGSDEKNVYRIDEYGYVYTLYNVTTDPYYEMHATYEPKEGNIKAFNNRVVLNGLCITLREPKRAHLVVRFPAGDLILAKKMLLETNEFQFRRTAGW